MLPFYFLFGPNASILGNIGNSYWNFVAIENVRDVISSTMQMAAIDFGILLATWLTLWIFCRINVFKEFCRLMKNWWSWIGFPTKFIKHSTSQFNFMFQHYLNLNINMAQDSTLKFEWITDEGRSVFLNQTINTTWEYLCLHYNLL